MPLVQNVVEISFRAMFSIAIQLKWVLGKSSFYHGYAEC